MDGGEDTGAPSYGTSFEDEPPLLQELGIDFQLIKQKVWANSPCVCVSAFTAPGFAFLQTLSVLNPLQVTDLRIVNDTDLAGPLIFRLLFGVVLLLVSYLPSYKLFRIVHT